VCLQLAIMVVVECCNSQSPLTVVITTRQSRIWLLVCWAVVACGLPDIYTYKDGIHTFRNQSLCWQRWKLLATINVSASVGDGQRIVFAKPTENNMYVELRDRRSVWIHTELSPNVYHAFENIAAAFILSLRVSALTPGNDIQLTSTNGYPRYREFLKLLFAVQGITVRDIPLPQLFCPPTSILYAKGFFRAKFTPTVAGELRRHAGLVILEEKGAKTQSAGRVLILKRKPHLRGWENYDEALAAICEMLRQHGLSCDPVSFETLSYIDQIKTVMQSVGLIAPHGAGLTHLVYLCLSCFVIEVFPECIYDFCYERLAKLSGVKYFKIMNGTTKQPNNLPSGLNIAKYRGLCNPTKCRYSDMVCRKTFFSGSGILKVELVLESLKIALRQQTFRQVVER